MFVRKTYVFAVSAVRSLVDSEYCGNILKLIEVHRIFVRVDKAYGYRIYARVHAAAFNGVFHVETRVDVFLGKAVFKSKRAAVVQRDRIVFGVYVRNNDIFTAYYSAVFDNRVFDNRLNCELVFRSVVSDGFVFKRYFNIVVRLNDREFSTR